MPKKLTYEDIKSSFELAGYSLVSKMYVNNKTALHYVCPKGHEGSIRWDNWNQGKRCAKCAGNVSLTIDFVRESFEKENYTLLSKEYINNNTKLKYICPKGHRHHTTWGNWNQDYRCPYCGGKVDITVDYICNELLKEDYELLSNEYIDAHSYLEVKCPKGHVYQVKWHNWKSGKRCPECNKINLSINRMGEKHHNWCGGIAYGAYCEVWKDKEYKKDIRERDENKCLNPYCDSKNPNDLTIHHIDYDKKNCHPKNLITVCRSCNARANFERKWHKAWYQAVLNKRYACRKIGKTLEA